MSHILAKLNGVRITEIEKKLKDDFLRHAAEGLFLEHVWQNTENQNEVLFLFRTKDLNRAKQFMDHAHAEALKDDPNVNLPEMKFLEGN